MLQLPRRGTDEKQSTYFGIPTRRDPNGFENSLLTGIEAIAAIIKEFPRAKIIVLSTFGGDEDIFKALQAGARAYFLKDVKGQDLVGAIRAVNAGQRPLPPEIASRLAERIPRSELSPRELEILRLIAKGSSNKEIANSLDISEGTVGSCQ